MATYTKGYKKKNPEQALLLTIVGIIGLVLLVVGAVFIYDLATDAGSYDDYTHIEAYDLILNQVDSSNQEISDYLVYFYSDDCSNCTSIKREALKLVEKIDNVPIFFVNASTIKETATGDKDIFEDLINATVRTPMVISITDGEFKELYSGTIRVIEILESVEEGTYTPFN